MDRYLTRIIERALNRWTDLDTRDYAGLLKLSGEYTVKELRVKKDGWLAGKKLKDCRLAQEGITVLGIYRSDGTYLGAPKGDTEIYEITLLFCMDVRNRCVNSTNGGLISVGTGHTNRQSATRKKKSCNKTARKRSTSENESACRLQGQGVKKIENKSLHKTGGWWQKRLIQFSMHTT